MFELDTPLWGVPYFTSFALAGSKTNMQSDWSNFQFFFINLVLFFLDAWSTCKHSSATTFITRRAKHLKITLINLSLPSCLGNSIGLSLARWYVIMAYVQCINSKPLIWLQAFSAIIYNLLKTELMYADHASFISVGSNISLKFSPCYCWFQNLHTLLNSRGCCHSASWTACGQTAPDCSWKQVDWDS